MARRGYLRRRGFEYERELASEFWKRGFACIRAPASGARVTRRVQPDLVAIKNGKVLVFEVKTKKKPGPIYIEEQQVSKLEEFSRRAGGEAFIAVKILDGRGWRFVPVSVLERTKKGRYRVTMETVGRGLKLRDLEAMVGGLYKRIDEYVGREED